jgi:dynactin 4
VKYQTNGRNYIPTLRLHPFSSKEGSTFLTPGTTQSFILTITNPLYDPIQLTLSTPSTTPGPYAHKTTILRPEFSVGANADIWNDDEDTVSPSDKRKSKFGIYEAKRNMISIFVEVVPAIILDVTGEIDVEIPVFVKMVYESEDVEKEDSLAIGSQASEEEKGKGKVEREIGYWVVIKVGSMKL